MSELSPDTQKSLAEGRVRFIIEDKEYSMTTHSMTRQEIKDYLAEHYPEAEVLEDGAEEIQY